jgi:hypothetical protein
MSKYVTVTPAYGRDYKSQREIKKDWNDGKDFILQPDGCYISKKEADGAHLKVMGRYQRMTKVVQLS